MHTMIEIITITLYSRFWRLAKYISTSIMKQYLGSRCKIRNNNAQNNSHSTIFKEL
jgi:hypothetical protein